MEKRTPHCPLERVRMLLSEGRVRTSRTASENAAALGFHAYEIVDLVSKLTVSDFYKSITTYGDHRVWQDVYRPWTAKGRLYIKLVSIDDVLIVSFKEL